MCRRKKALQSRTRSLNDDLKERILAAEMLEVNSKIHLTGDLPGVYGGNALLSTRAFSALVTDEVEHSDSKSVEILAHKSVLVVQKLLVYEQLL